MAEANFTGTVDVERARWEDDLGSMASGVLVWGVGVVMVGFLA